MSGTKKHKTFLINIAKQHDDIEKYCIYSTNCFANFSVTTQQKYTQKLKACLYKDRN